MDNELDFQLRLVEKQVGEAQDLMARGERAKEILDDPLVIEAFETIERVWGEAWKSSRLDDAQGRERAYQCLRSALDFKEFFKQALEKGSEAKLLLPQMHEHRESLYARLKRVIGF